MTKTITVYSKTTGCPQCERTKKILERDGLLGITKIIYIDQPEHAEVLASLKAEGLTQAPVVMLDFPVECRGQVIDHWTGLDPDALKAAREAVLGE